MSGTGRPPRVDELLRIESPFRRRLLFAALLGEALSERGGELTVVGGTALEFYTLGSYATQDLDIVTSASALVGEILVEWRFAREGRFWYDQALDLAVEIPGSALAGDPDRIVRAEVDGTHVALIGCEDLLVDRLSAAVHWESPADRLWARAVFLAHRDRLDMQYLTSRCEALGLASALDELMGEGDGCDGEDG